LKKLLERKPFQKRLDRKPLLNLKRHDGVITSLFKKGLTENSSNNVVGMINRRNGCGTSLFKKGLTENLRGCLKIKYYM